MRGNLPKRPSGSFVLCGGLFIALTSLISMLWIEGEQALPMVAFGVAGALYGCYLLYKEKKQKS